MTLQLRPSFSESWYRVANLKARLRAGAQISRQFYRDERWYVVRDPAGNQYHRLSDAAYRFVGLLDGTRTVQEAWDLVGGTLEDDAPTQPEVIQILSHLYSANLVDADVTPDATVLLRRHKQLSKRKMQGRLMNVLFPRIPIWDPDRFLRRWMPLAKIGFSKFGALVWLAVVITACVLLAPYWHSGPHGLIDAARHSVDLKTNMVNAVMLWGVFVLIKLIHELGHAFSCRRFGGECHELGIMLMVFMPTPYVDASSAWSFRNKWHRIFVGAAGMIVELFFASLCAFIWINTGDPRSIIGQLSFNAMLVASFTTVVFNANPLLRYDGYYILSDFLEIPNLRQKSSDYTLGLLKRHLFGVKLQQPLPPVLQRFWLFLYSVASSAYRLFVGFMIVILVYYQLPEYLQWLGLLMAAGGVITWLFVPVYKTFKYLAIDPELHRNRTRATIITLVAAAGFLIAFGLIPFPDNVDQPAVVEAHGFESVRPERAGFVQAANIFAQDHQWLKGPVRDAKGKITQEGDVIFIAEDPELEMEIRKARADLGRYEVDLSKALAGAQQDDPTADIEIAKSQVDLAKDKLNTLLEKKNDLTVRAPIDGYLIAPKLKELAGAYVKQGQEVAQVINPDKLTLQVLVEQKEFGMIISSDPDRAKLFDHQMDEITQAEERDLKAVADEKSNRLTAAESIRFMTAGYADTVDYLIQESADAQRINIAKKADKKRQDALFDTLADSIRKSKTEIRLVSRIGDVVQGGEPHLRWSATADVAAGNTVRAGGEAQVDPQHPDKLMYPAFRVDLPMINPDSDVVPGQTAWVRFKLRRQPLYLQEWRKLLQLIQTNETAHRPS